MADRELLELAAKAAGIANTPTFMRLAGNEGINRGPLQSLWNPLADDGDALRLAVKLNFNIYSCDLYSIAEFISDGLKYAATKKEYCDSETKYAATRRAIVRAAAEIGKAM